jgi:hypothetical protein
MDDGNEKEEESGYGEELDCCLYSVQPWAKSRAAVKWRAVEILLTINWRARRW